MTAGPHDRFHAVAAADPPQDRLPRQAILLAGGRGTRLGSMTRDLPKSLLPVQGVSVIERLIHRLSEAGITACTVVTCHRAEQVEQHLANAGQLGVQIDVLREPHPLGTAGCLGLLPRPDRPFLLVNGDIVTDLCFRRLAVEHLRAGATATVAVRRQVSTLEFGVVEFDHIGRVHGYREKPTHEAFVAMGIACLDPRVCDHVGCEEAVSMPALLTRLIAAGEPIFSHRHDGLWVDIGRPDDYAACQQMVLPAIGGLVRRAA